MARHREGAILGFAEERRRAPEPAILDRVLEYVEVALVVHRELTSDLARLLEREDLGEVFVTGTLRKLTRLATVTVEQFRTALG